MSATWRERLNQRRREIGIEGSEYNYIQRYIDIVEATVDVKKLI